jgi:hypothetical protein
LDIIEINIQNIQSDHSTKYGWHAGENSEFLVGNIVGAGGGNRTRVISLEG